MSVQAPPPPARLNPQPRTVLLPAAQPQATHRPPSTVTNNARAHTPAFQRAKKWVKELLGYAGTRRAQRDRREIVRLIMSLAYSGAQIVVILTLTILGATTTSPLRSDVRSFAGPQSELSVCTLLGVWNLLWLGKLIIWGYLKIWMFRRKRQIRRTRRAARVRQRAARQELPPLEFQQGEQQQPGPNAVPEEGEVDVVHLCPLTWTSIRLFLYRADIIVTLVWFFTAILVSWQNGSLCRNAAKDISFASYTILLMVYIQYILTIIVPTIRIVMARRRANQPIVGKLSRRDVDRIPLVLYIPPPPNETPASPVTPMPRSVTHPIPTPTPLARPPSKRRRFISFRPTLRRRDTKTDVADVERGTEAMSPTEEEGDDWDRTWERGSYPFVRLPENRATCMICLSDFEAPRRVSEGATQPMPEVNAVELRPLSSATMDVEELQVESPREADARTIELADGGSSDAPQPLRLLSCGHVYHKDCVDPWLIDKSGRCPYCSARVEVPPASTPERRNSIWRRGTV